MAAVSMGLFGTYKYAYKKQLETEKELCNKINNSNEVVWVLKRYTPNDLRFTAPVPRYKPMATTSLPTPPSNWVPVGEAPFSEYARENGLYFPSKPSTRCEEWSTLRQLLPSTGRARRVHPPNWGTGLAPAPAIVPEIQKRFPHSNSPMTRYVDAMHLTNREFSLH